VDGLKHSISKVLQPVSTAPDSKVLSSIKHNIEFFDPANKMHRKSYYDYKKTGKWSIRFHNEYPYTDVVSMITYKIVEYMEMSDNAG
jgi:hypothetical protein